MQVRQKHVQSGLVVAVGIRPEKNVFLLNLINSISDKKTAGWGAHVFGEVGKSVKKEVPVNGDDGS